jgi:site-specific recombinase XerD
MIEISNKFDTLCVKFSGINAIDRFLFLNSAKVAQINKPLTMHIVRHSFGNISGDKILVQMLQKLYTHSDIKTNIGYQLYFIYKDVDEALDSVLSF